MQLIDRAPRHLLHPRVEDILPLLEGSISGDSSSGGVFTIVAECLGKLISVDASKTLPLVEVCVLPSPDLIAVIPP